MISKSMEKASRLYDTGFVLEGTIEDADLDPAYFLTSEEEQAIIGRIKKKLKLLPDTESHPKWSEEWSRFFFGSEEDKKKGDKWLAALGEIEKMLLELSGISSTLYVHTALLAVRRARSEPKFMPIARADVASLFEVAMPMHKIGVRRLLGYPKPCRCFNMKAFAVWTSEILGLCRELKNHILLAYRWALETYPEFDDIVDYLTADASALYQYVERASRYLTPEYVDAVSTAEGLAEEVAPPSTIAWESTPIARVGGSPVYPHVKPVELGNPSQGGSEGIEPLAGVHVVTKLYKRVGDRVRRGDRLVQLCRTVSPLLRMSDLTMLLNRIMEKLGAVRSMLEGILSQAESGVLGAVAGAPPSPPEAPAVTPEERKARCARFLVEMRGGGAKIGDLMKRFNLNYEEVMDVVQLLRSFGMVDISPRGARDRAEMFVLRAPPARREKVRLYIRATCPICQELLAMRPTREGMSYEIERDEAGRHASPFMRALDRFAKERGAELEVINIDPNPERYIAMVGDVDKGLPVFAYRDRTLRKFELGLSESDYYQMFSGTIPLIQRREEL